MMGCVYQAQNKINGKSYIGKTIHTLKYRKKKQVNKKKKKEGLKHQKRNVLAILTSDIHLSLKAPTARSCEPDWLLAMKRPLDELKRLSKKHNAIIIYAGDIFDHAIENSELINFAIDNLPKGYSVWGQHDAPYHSRDELYKSAYETLVKLGILTDLKYSSPVIVNGRLKLYGFPWGSEIKNITKPNPEYIHVAVIHKYIWMGKHKFPTAKDEDRVAKVAKKLKGYDVAIFGDNHKGFLFNQDGCTILNCGAFIRRTTPEIDYTPIVGLLYADGIVQTKKLNTEIDQFVSKEEVIELAKLEGIEGLLEELESPDDDAIDFAQALRNYVNSGSVNNEVRKRVIGALEASMVKE